MQNHQNLNVMQPGSFSFTPAQRVGLSTRIVPYTIHAAAHTPDNSLITDDITEDTDDEEGAVTESGRGGVGTRRVTRPVFPWRMDRRDYPQRSLSHTSDGGGASHMEDACAALVRMRAWPTATTTRAERCDSVMSGRCAVESCTPSSYARQSTASTEYDGRMADAEYAPALANRFRWQAAHRRQ